MYDESQPTADGQEPMSAQVWLDRLDEYKQDFDKWSKQLENLDKLYTKAEKADSADREYSIFWANIEVLRPAVYARAPVPVVAPRFKERNPVASAASDILERCLVVTIEQSDAHGLLTEVRDEYLRYARGTAWVRLGVVDDGMTPRIEFDHVDACDFAHSISRKWREVWWVGRRVYMDEDEGTQRFGDVFREVPRKKKDETAVTKQRTDKAHVWEIWCKKTRKVYWVAEDYDTVLDTQDPWLDLTHFWPCPKPAYGTTHAKTLRPVPEIIQYKDQIEEVNEYTARIAALSESLKMRGFYPAGGGDLSEAIEAAMKATDNRTLLMPISSVAALGGGSFKDAVVWWPVADVLTLITGLVELRRVVIDDIYQITGISDIVRGSTQASETATAQQIKSQWGSLRIRERQNELIRFSRDLMRISAEIIAENFPPETMLEMSQVALPTQAIQQQAQAMLAQAQQAAQMAAQAQQMGMQPPPMPDEGMMKQAQEALKKPSLEDVMAFLRNDKARGFVIEVETDSTIQPDEDAEKNRRIEFVTSVGGLFQQAAPIIMQAPQIAPFMGEVLKFAAGGFRAGRPLESAIDELVEQMKGMAERAMQPQPPQPDPQVELKKAEIELKREEGAQKLQFERERHEQTMAFEREKATADRDANQATEAKRIEASSRPTVALSADGAMNEVAAQLTTLAQTNTEAIQQAAQTMAGVSTSMAQVAQEVAAAARAMAAPKRVVRGPDGRAVGTEAVM
jgi:hypothetical protein